MNVSPPHSLAHSNPATSLVSEDPPDQSFTTNTAQTPHWELATNAHTAASELFSFMDNKPKNEESFAKTSEICLDRLTAIAATADKSKLSTMFCKFDEAWENIPYYCHQLMDDDKRPELDTLINSVECTRKELGIKAFDPTGCADPSRVEHYWIVSNEHNSRSNDTYHKSLN